jgi:hypothetical protein
VAGPGYEHALTPREEEILREDIAALHALAAALSDAFSFEAFPTPQLRVRPPL